MRITICILAFGLFATAATSFAAKEAVVGPIAKLSSAKPNQTVFKDAKRNAPIEIKTADGLAKYFDEKQAAAIAKEVDFKQQLVLIFAWRGSGQDKLNFDVGESFPETILFRIKPGRTRDLRPHVQVFALRSNVKWSVK